MENNLGRSMTDVLDVNHGVDELECEGVILYAPWYSKKGVTRYYTSRQFSILRAEYPTHQQAVDHIARSRRMRHDR